MSSPWRGILTGTTSVAIIASAGLGFLGYHAFKDEQKSKVRHEASKRPMYLVNEQMYPQEEDTFTKVQQEVLTTSVPIRNKSFQHPCSGQDLEWSTSAIPIRLVRRSDTNDLELDLKDVFISPPEYSTLSQYRVFQDYRSTTTNSSSTTDASHHQALILLQAENNWQPEQNFTLYMRVKYRIGKYNNLKIISASFDSDCPNTVAPSSSRVSAVQLKRSKHGSTTVSTFAFGNLKDVQFKVIPVGGKAGGFHVLVQFIGATKGASFLIDSAQPGKSYSLVLPLVHLNIVRHYKFRINEEGQIEMPRLQSEFASADVIIKPIQYAPYNAVYSLIVDNNQIVQWIVDDANRDDHSFAQRPFDQDKTITFHHLLDHWLLTTQFHVHNSVQVVASKEQEQREQSQDKTEQVKQFMKWVKDKYNTYYNNNNAQSV